MADYIPALGEVAPRQFGMAVALCNGESHTVGDAHTAFSLQSITKLFTFVLALKLVGDELWQRVGREPSGAAFNSIVQLETENGIPRNPFINAGALVVTDILTSRYAHLDYALLGALRRLVDDPALYWNPRIAKSERDTAHRNMAMAYFMKSHGNFHNEPELVLDNYCRQCATEMSCAQLAQATMFLANDGTRPGPPTAGPDEQSTSAPTTGQKGERPAADLRRLRRGRRLCLPHRPARENRRGRRHRGRGARRGHGGHLWSP